MAHDQKSRDLTPEKALESMGSVLGGIENFVETAERIIKSLHQIAKSVRTMEEDGSLIQLAELLQEAEQAPSSLSGDSQDETGSQRDEDDL
ncbi:MAG: hypothetical protein GX977_10845 [Firmicutes bacterium]|nr:hypothetical protein [Bacillota bacterium]